MRVRGASGYKFDGMPWWLSKHIVPLIHFVKQRKQLLGVSKRAELRSMRKDDQMAATGDHKEGGVNVSQETEE